jgi:7,8-dihydroneopterin aldolase/epimerase/oxygenase
MKGVIEIVGLVSFARHGVGEDGAKHGQRFVLDLTLEVDVDKAARTDQLADTIDYGEVIVVAEAAFHERRFYLIEAAAAHVAAAMLAHFPSARVARVTVRKPSAPVPATIDHVAATVERRRDG